MNASGVAGGTDPLPSEFSQTEKVKWKAELGDGIGSPIIAGGRLFTTAMVGEQKFAVFCFDAASGEMLWRREFETGKLPRITPPNSHASSTPASDGKRVYVYFSTLGLMALDAVDGKTAWERPIPLPAYLMDWGAAESPIVYRDLVIFNQDDDLAPTLFAFDAMTGSVRWRTERPDMLAGYSIPVICEAGGQTDLVVAGTGKLKGYNPQTGEERWTCNTLLRTIMTSPVVRDGVIYVANQSYGDEKRTLKFALLEWLDTNQDKRLARDELPREFWKRFDASDKDQNGFIEDDELDTAFQSADNMVGGGATIQAIRGGGRGNVTDTHLLWQQNYKVKVPPSNLSSPIVVGDQLFLVKKGGLSSSFDAATGHSRWELARIKNIGEYFASPVAGDGKIYIAGENGFVVVVAQGPQLRVLAKNDMGEPCIATPAIADGKIYIRTRESLYCICDEAK
ncbi:MAG TPA: PQQ-binding-like beta-propeller repeat protein [Planctomycetaceae bacterium]|nr:PQQ-binding-like beta-propeller repeat protein [Planctomycetaceae bacterium]